MSAFFPWPVLLWAGMGVLKWPPSIFWNATLQELVAALRNPPLSSTILKRSDLLDLMRDFPDNPSDKGSSSHDPFHSS